MLIFLFILIGGINALFRPMENPSLFEGDMILTPKQLAFYTNQRNSYGSIAEVTKLWPNAVVPYEIRDDLRKIDLAMKELRHAFDAFHRYTCVRFAPRDQQKDYVIFRYGSSCSSYVGKQGLLQYIQLGNGCHWRGVIQHEIMHAIGFEHEQSRPDRSAYVSILYENLDPSVHSQFHKQTSTHINSLGTPYDLNSLMHYKWNSFSKRMSIRTKDPKYQYLIGQRNGFSPIDVLQINKLYKCKGSYPTVSPITLPPPGCYDISPFCAANANLGKCTEPKMRWFMSTECRLTCKICGHGVTTTTTTQNPYCFDKRTGCAVKRRRGYCKISWMKDRMMRECQSTCGWCNRVTPQPTTATTVISTKPSTTLITDQTKRPTTLITDQTKRPTTLITDQTKRPTTLITDQTKRPTTLITDQTKRPTILITDQTKRPTILITDQTKRPATLHPTTKPTTKATRPITRPKMTTLKKTTKGGTVCRDRVSSCRGYPKSHCHKKGWEYFMKRSCRKFCGFC